jgi:hypothetical protein
VNNSCPRTADPPNDRPHITGPLAGARIDRQRAISTRTRLDFERGTSEPTLLTPGAPASRQASRRQLTRPDDRSGDASRRPPARRLTAGCGTRRPALRGAFAQTVMRAAPMVVGDIRAKHATEMPVDDHVVQTSREATLGEWVRSGTSAAYQKPCLGRTG